MPHPPYPHLGSAQIIRADSRNLPLGDNSVDLVVTSPPYFALRSYQDGGQHYAGQIGGEPTPAAFIDSLLKVTRECVRVLKPTGSLFVNLGDKYAGSIIGGQTTLGLGKQRAGTDALSRIGITRPGSSDGNARRASAPKAPSDFRGVRPKSLVGIPWRYALRCIDDLGLILRAEVVWSKPNGLPESVTDRVRRSHEQWFHFTLQPRYFSTVSEVPGAIPGSVWTVPTEPLRVPESLGIDHFAAFPTAWPRKIIGAWCPEGGTVLDPFGGTGTTAMVAKALGRYGISVDMSADYCRIAEWRTDDRDQLAKVLGIAKAEGPTQDESLLDLLDGGAA